MDATSPVIKSLEDSEILIAKDQPEYKTLPVLRLDGGFILCRFVVTDADLIRIKRDRSIYVYMLTGNNPVTPIAIETETPEIKIK